MDLTALDKRIYNAHLIASRKAKNQPFKLRENFDKVDDKTYVQLKKLSSFFSNNSSVNIDDFFNAPYKYYEGEEYYALDFFTTMKAAKCYSLYKKSKELQDPDSEETINSCKTCCAFIYKYCRENNISLEQYKTHVNGTTPIVLQHLKEHHINFYTIHGLNSITILKQTEPEILDFFISDFNIILNETRINFQKSTKLKHTIRKAFEIIDNQLSQIQKQNNNNQNNRKQEI